MWMATRSNQALRDSMMQSMNWSYKAYRKLWDRSLTGRSPPTMIAECRRIVVHVMRGIVISRIFIADQSSVHLTIATCKKIMARYLHGVLDHPPEGTR